MNADECVVIYYAVLVIFTLGKEVPIASYRVMHVTYESWFFPVLLNGYVTVNNTYLLDAMFPTSSGGHANYLDSKESFASYFPRTVNLLWRITTRVFREISVHRATYSHRE